MSNKDCNDCKKERAQCGSYYKYYRICSYATLNLQNIQHKRNSIKKFEKLSKYLEDIDIDNSSKQQQNQILDMFNFCRIGHSKYKSLYVYKKNQSFSVGDIGLYDLFIPDVEESITKDCIKFDIIKFASNVMNNQKLVKKRVAFDKTYSTALNGYFQIEQPYATILCSPDFDSTKVYSQEELVTLLQNKQIFFLKSEIFWTRLSDKQLCCIKNNNLQSILLEPTKLYHPDYKNDEQLTLPAKTIVNNRIRKLLEDEGFKTLDKYRFLLPNYFWTRTQKAFVFAYISRMEKLYPNFTTEFLKQVKTNLPNEILARKKVASEEYKKAKKEIETFFKRTKKRFENKIKENENEIEKLSKSLTPQDTNTLSSLELYKDSVQNEKIIVETIDSAKKHCLDSFERE